MDPAYPHYDNADKCEFCEDIKVQFTEKLEETRQMMTERLWGLCLDCFKAGGVHLAECRYEHKKILPAGANGLGINGL